MPFHHIISYRWKEKKWWRKIPFLLLRSIKDCVFKLFRKWLILFFRKFPIISHSCYTKWDDFSGFRWLMRWGETISFCPRGWQGKLIVVHSVRPADEINFFWFMLSAGRTEWTKSKGDFPPGRRSKQKVVEVIRRADGKRRSHWNSRFKWQVKKERRNLWSKKSSLD